MPKPRNLEGMRFGRLVALKKVNSVNGATAWLCRCDCGNEKVILTNNLVRNTFSCGCYQREIATNAQTRHGMARTNIYMVWISMRARCHNPKDKSYGNYGERGISVCDEWDKDFQSFYSHVSSLPNFGEVGYSIDRIDNDKNYEPGNVRWATRTEQRKNQRPRSKEMCKCK